MIKRVLRIINHSSEFGILDLAEEEVVVIAAEESVEEFEGVLGIG